MLVGSKLSQAPKIIISTGLFAFHLQSFSFLIAFSTTMSSTIQELSKSAFRSEMEKYFGKSKFRILDPFEIVIFSFRLNITQNSSETYRLDASKF